MEQASLISSDGLLTPKSFVSNKKPHLLNNHVCGEMSPHRPHPAPEPGRSPWSYLLPTRTRTVGSIFLSPPHSICHHRTSSFQGSHVPQGSDGLFRGFLWTFLSHCDLWQMRQRATCWFFKAAIQQSGMSWGQPS